MGWWETRERVQIGDGALDLTEQFLRDLCTEYKDELERKPSLDEILASLTSILHTRADEFTADGEFVIVDSIHAKLKKRPKKQHFKPGDVFIIPLENGNQIFGRVTPEYLRMEFYPVAISSVRSFTKLRTLSPFELTNLIDPTALESGRWKIIGNLPFGIDFFARKYRVADKMACSTNLEPDGFIHPSSELSFASEEELNKLPKIGIAPYSYIEKKLSELEIP